MDKCFDSHAGVTRPVWKFLRLEREELEGGGEPVDGLAFSDELRVFLSFSWKREGVCLHDLERENAVLFFPPFSSSSSTWKQRRASERAQSN